MKHVNTVGRGHITESSNFREPAVKTQISGTRQKENHNAKATHVTESINPTGKTAMILAIEGLTPTKSAASPGNCPHLGIVVLCICLKIINFQKISAYYARLIRYPVEIITPAPII